MNKISIPKIIKALILCRVSGDRQVREGHGLDSQEQRCRKYAEEKGYLVENVFYDEGITGAIFERKGLQELLKYLDEHPFDNYVVIFDNLDRIAKDVLVHWRIRGELSRRGATVESPNFHFEDTPEGRLFENITASTNQYGRENNTRQVSQKMKSRLEDGYYCFPAPIGFKYKKIKGRGKILFPKYPQANIVEEALEGFANDRFLRQVDMARFLESKKEILGKKKIYRFFINRILENVFLYAGWVEYLKWDISKRKGKHEGIIKNDICEKILKKLDKKPEKKITARDKAEFPLRGLVYCNVCGKKMTGSNVKGKLRYYAMYTCNNKDCSANPKNIQKHILEREYINLLKNTAPESQIIELSKAIALDVWKESIKGLNISQKSLESEIREKEKAIKSYLRLIPKVKSDLMREKYEEQIEGLEREVRELKGESLDTSKMNFEEALQEVMEFVGTPLKYWEKSGLEGKLEVHQMVFPENLKFDLQNGFGTPKKALPFRINRDLVSTKSRDVGYRGLFLKRVIEELRGWSKLISSCQQLGLSIG